MSRAGRARVIDIAQEAGVSIATVDRVLNKRAGVRPMTAERVIEAAERLRTGAATGEARRATGLTFDFILPADAGLGMVDLHGFIEQAGQAHGVTTRCHTVERINPVAMAQAIQAAGADASDGIGFHALEHPLVREAVDRLAVQGVPAVAMLSDLASSRRVGYVGMDNRAAGRTAGYLMGRFLCGAAGKVAILAGSTLYRSHEEREMGFRSVVRDSFPALQTMELLVGKDAPEANYAHTTELLNHHADLLGIYNLGSGNRGIVQALRERGAKSTVTFIGHNLTSATREYLLEGAMDAIIHRDLAREAQAAVQMLLNQHGASPAVFGGVPVEIFVRENIIS